MHERHSFLSTSYLLTVPEHHFNQESISSVVIAYDTAKM